jgi:hypothetical protein
MAKMIQIFRCLSLTRKLLKREINSHPKRMILKALNQTGLRKQPKSTAACQESQMKLPDKRCECSIRTIDRRKRKSLWARLKLRMQKLLSLVSLRNSSTKKSGIKTRFLTRTSILAWPLLKTRSRITNKQLTKTSKCLWWKCKISWQRILKDRSNDCVWKCNHSKSNSFWCKQKLPHLQLIRLSLKLVMLPLLSDKLPA